MKPASELYQRRLVHMLKYGVCGWERGGPGAACEHLWSPVPALCLMFYCRVVSTRFERCFINA